MTTTLEGMTQARWSALTKRERDDLRDLSGLSPQLVGLEGWRVEVVDDPGFEHLPDPEPRRFYVGRSAGWRPAHLEIARKDSSGGFAASRKYRSVRHLYKREGYLG